MILLNGCGHITMNTDLDTSILEYPKSQEKTVMGHFAIEIDSCESRRDVYTDSNLLKISKKNIPEIFLGAKYEGCEYRGHTAFALFKIPIYINGGCDGNTFITLNSNEDNFLTMYVPQGLLYSAESSVARDINPQKMNIELSFTLNNTSRVTLRKMVPAHFINGEAIIGEEIEIQEGDRVEIKLSKISITQLIENQETVILK